MDKNREIAGVYKILGLYEDMCTSKGVTKKDYLTYLDRIYIMYLGTGDKEIYGMLKGLWELGPEAGHSRVKSVVFHIIDLISKGGDELATL